MLQFADSFDYYGFGAVGGNLALNGWTITAVAWVENASLSRTGTGAIYLNGGGGVRRPVTPQNVIGVGAGYFPVGMPINNAFANGISFLDTGGTFIGSVCAQGDNSLAVVGPANTILGKSPPNSVPLGSYWWIEAKCTRNTAGVNTGSIELRWQGDPLVTVNGINIPNQIGFIDCALRGQGDCRIDDLLIWDDTGARNNNFLGDKRLETSFIDADTAATAFLAQPAVGAGLKYTRADNNPANDAEYIYSAIATDVSEFERQNITIANNQVDALIIMGRLSKSDAGACQARLGIRSNAFVDNSAPMNVATAWRWWSHVSELNPDGLIPWTKATADLALLRITHEL